MNNLVQLRKEIAKMRLMDLTKEHGKDSQRVNNYRKRVGKMVEVNQQKQITAAHHNWVGNY